MPMCEVGKEIPGQDITPEKLILEDGWGELWRAEHRSFGQVFFVAYSTSAGMKAFKSAEKQLMAIHQGGGVATDFLLKIKKISTDSAIPYTLIEDPGGKSLYDFSSDEMKVIDYEKVVDWGIQIVEAVMVATNMGVLPIGITPKLLLFDTLKKDKHPWRIIPILPGAREQTHLLENGRYSPPELISTEQPSMINADIYATTWIMIECMAKNFEIDHDPMAISQHVQAQKLLMAIMVGTQSSAGMYPDPATMASQMKRWRRADAETDLKKIRKIQTKEKKAIEKAKKKGGKPVKVAKGSTKNEKNKDGTSTKHPGIITGVESKGPDAGKIMIRIFFILLLFGVPAVGYLAFDEIKGIFVAEATNNTGSGTASLFMQAIIEDNPAEYNKYTNSVTKGQASSLVNMLDSIGDTGQPVKGAGNAKVMNVDVGFLVEMTVFDMNDSPVMVLLLQIEPRSDPPGTYHITGINTQGL